MLALLLAACVGKGVDSSTSCEPVPADKQPPSGYRDACEVDGDCPSGMVCRTGAGGYYYWYDLTCTTECATDDDCFVVQGSDTCGEGPYCDLVSCVDGICAESTCM